jgi:hypothetical protein
LWVRGWDLEVKIGIHIPVEIEFPTLHQLQDRGPREELGDRTDTKHRPLWINRVTASHV